MPSTAPTYAAIDLGSNSFHLLIARYDSGRIVTIDRQKEMVRLAAGLSDEGVLNDEAKQRALDCLTRFAELIADLPPQQVRAVGTNTLRAAQDNGEFLAQAQARLGTSIDIISGVEEARLVYQGVSKDFNNQCQRLVVDIGGGSTEFILGRRQPIELESLFMGCVSYSNRFFPNGDIRPEYFARARLAAQQELQAITSQFNQRHWQEAVGSSGTVKNLLRVQEALIPGGHVITWEGLQLIEAEILKASHFDEIELPDQKKERKPVVVGGLAILMAVFEELGVETMHVSNYTMKEGILYDLAGRADHNDRRDQTIDQMVLHYRVDRDQVRRVENLAHNFLLQMGSELTMPFDEASQLLRWACELHEVGFHISPSGFQRHSSYLISNSDMPGFSRQEQQQIAFVVINQRRKLKALKNSYGRQQDWRLVLALRLSCLFNRRRVDRELPPIELSFQDNRCLLKIPANWLEQHPLTQQGLQDEVEAWRCIGVNFELLAD